MPGLPAALPPGERVLWQGRPAWRALARRALHVRKVAAYFGVLLAACAASALWTGASFGAAAAYALKLAPFALGAVGLLALFAWLAGRTTVYTITDRRVVLHIGVALTMDLNLPFRRIGSAALKVHADGTGDIPLALTDGARVAYLHLWPHARPWRLARPEPMLRSVPDAARVAAVLAEALAAAQGETAANTRDGRAPAEAPRPLENAAA